MEKFKREKIYMALLLVITAVCVLIMLTLCFDQGIDFDEAYSYRAARDYTVGQIIEKIVVDHDTDVPLYYCALRIWICLFGDSFMACRLFSVAGTAASMLLGLTVIRKLWGYRTAALFIISTSLAPAMLHVGVNIRMYSWTSFLVTASAVLAFCIVQDTRRRYQWVLLWLCTFAGLFSHYFTAFCYLVIYVYLLVQLFYYEKKALWKVFVCGLSALAPLIIWMLVSDFFHFVQSEGKELGETSVFFRYLLDYMFKTDIMGSVWLGFLLVVMALAGALLFYRKRKQRGERAFILMCVTAIFVIYFIALGLTAFATHFFTVRHIMHAIGIMWLGIAIVLPRINWPAYLSGLAIVTGICCSNYKREYRDAYSTTPYLEETVQFIREEMQPGDTVIYTAIQMFDLLYGCYMPEQNFLHLREVDDIQALAGKRVWFFSTDHTIFFEQEDVEKYGISSQNMGHYGFQIISNCTDFDILRLEIRGAETVDVAGTAK